MIELTFHDFRHFDSNSGSHYSKLYRSCSHSDTGRSLTWTYADVTGGFAVMKNPSNLAKHQGNPKVAPVIAKMFSKFAGGAGA